MKSRALTFFALFLLTSCVDSTQQRAVEPSLKPSPKELRVAIPPDFEKHYYLKSIDEFAAKNDLPKLRETNLPVDDIEVRVHVGFGLYGVDELVLRRTSGDWESYHYLGMLCHHENRGIAKLGVPKSGWDAAWQSLLNAGLLSLSGIKDSGINDGTSYIVETSLNETYSVYAFGNPDYLKNSEGDQMVEIGEVLAEEFGLDTFRVHFPCK